MGCKSGTQLSHWTALSDIWAEEVRGGFQSCYQSNSQVTKHLFTVWVKPWEENINKTYVSRCWGILHCFRETKHPLNDQVKEVQNLSQAHYLGLDFLLRYSGPSVLDYLCPGDVLIPFSFYRQLPFIKLGLTRTYAYTFFFFMSLNKSKWPFWGQKKKEIELI